MMASVATMLTLNGFTGPSKTCSLQATGGSRLMSRYQVAQA